METIETTDTLKNINTTPHLCRSKVKQTALELAAAIRPANKFKRVGMSFVERIEAKVRAAIREAHAYPAESVGGPDRGGDFQRGLFHLAPAKMRRG